MPTVRSRLIVGCRGSFLPLVKTDPRHRRGSFCRPRRDKDPHQTILDHSARVALARRGHSCPVPSFFDLGLGPWTFGAVASRPAIGGWVTNFVGHLSENKFVTQPPVFPPSPFATSPAARNESALSIQPQNPDPSKLIFLGIRD